MAHRKQINPTPFTRRQALMALLGSIALPGCGGGSVAGLSSGGTGSFTNGVIIGLGSIIVNGIRYDDTKATVNSGTGASNDLKLGMVVSVQGSSVTPPTVTGGLATATASSISYGSEWKGPVDSVDTANNSFVVFGQTVKVLGTTVFDAGTLSSLAGKFVEVHGFLDPGSNALSASRVEVKNSLSAFRLSGAIKGLEDGNFTMGSVGTPVRINYADTPGDERPTSLQNGMLVRVELELELAQDNTNAWIATSIRSVNALADIEYDDDDEAEVEGSITAFTSNSGFSVNGIPVNALHADFELNGIVLDLGMRVKVEGAVANGTIVASKVEVESNDAVEAREFEFHGTLSELTATDFKVRGYTVSYARNLIPNNVVWANGLNVEVKAVNGSNGQLQATGIEADSDD